MTSLVAEKTKTCFKVEVYFGAFDEWIPIATFTEGGQETAVEFMEFKQKQDPKHLLQVAKYVTSTTTTREAIERF